MKINPARWRAQIAHLYKEYGVGPEQLARLTPKQIHDYYFHKRNKDGHIDIPDADFAIHAPDVPPTLENEMLQLERLFGIFGGREGWDEAAKEQLKANLRAKFDGKAS